MFVLAPTAPLVAFQSIDEVMAAIDEGEKDANAWLDQRKVHQPDTSGVDTGTPSTPHPGAQMQAQPPPVANPLLIGVDLQHLPLSLQPSASSGSCSGWG